MWIVQLEEQTVDALAVDLTLRERIDVSLPHECRDLVEEPGAGDRRTGAAEPTLHQPAAGGECDAENEGDGNRARAHERRV